MRRQNYAAYRDWQQKDTLYWQQQPVLISFAGFLAQVKREESWNPAREIASPRFTRGWSETSDYPIYKKRNEAVKKVALIGDWRTRLVSKQDETWISLKQNLVDPHPPPADGLTDVDRENWDRAQAALSVLTSQLGKPSVAIKKSYPGIFGTTTRAHSYQWEVGRTRITYNYHSLIRKGQLVIQRAGSDYPVKRLQPLVFLRCRGSDSGSATGKSLEVDMVYGLDYNKNELLHEDTSTLGKLDPHEYSVEASLDFKKKDERGEFRIKSEIEIDRTTGRYSEVRQFSQGNIEIQSEFKGACKVIDRSEKLF